MAVDFKGYKDVQHYLNLQIPYVELLNIPQDEERTIIQNDNGRIFSVYRIIVEDDKLDEEVLHERSKELASLLSSNFDNSIEFTLDFIRSAKHYDLPLVQTDEQYKNANDLFTRRQKTLEHEVFYENSIYFSICYTPPKLKTKKRQRTILTSKHVDFFLDKRTNLEILMKNAGYRPMLLAKDELITYLYKGFTNEFEEGTERIISEPITEIKTYFAKNTNMYPGIYPLLINERINACCAFHALPRYTFPDMLNEIIKINGSVRIFLKYNCRDVSEAKTPIDKQMDEEKKNLFKFRLRGQDPNLPKDPDEMNLDAVKAKEECKYAIAHMLDENLAAGYLSINIILSAPKDNEEMLDNLKKNITSRLSLMGIKEDFFPLVNTQRYFDSVLIGCGAGEKLDSFYCLADNTADFFPVSGSTLFYNSPHLEKVTGSNIPFMFGKTDRSGLFKYSPFGEGEIGHAFMVGGSGEGKSITLAHMSNEWLKYDNTRVVYIDMGLSMLHTVKENGGVVFYPGGDGTSFCPLKCARDHKAQALAFLESIAVSNDVKLTSRERVAIDTIIEKHLPYGKETLERFFILYKGKVKDSPFTDVLQQYIDVYGYLFNGKDDAFLNLPRICGIELEKLFEGNLRTLIYPSLVYILNSLERYFVPEEPTYVVFDEAWRYLQDEFFASFIVKWLKQLRKQNACVIIATQEITDLSRSKIAETIFNNCPTQIFLRNTKAMSDVMYQWYQGIGIPEHIISKISKLKKFTQIISQDGAYRQVSWMVRDEIKNLKTEDSEKLTFRHKYQE